MSYMTKLMINALKSVKKCPCIIMIIIERGRNAHHDITLCCGAVVQKDLTFSRRFLSVSFTVDDRQ